MEVSEAEIKERYDEELDLYMTDILRIRVSRSFCGETSDASLEISEEDILGAGRMVKTRR